MKNFRSILLSFVFILTTLSLLTACNNEREETPFVKIGHAPHDHHAALYVAAEMPEYFKQHGGIFLEKTNIPKQFKLYKDSKLLANVEIVQNTGGMQLVRKLKENQLDYSFGGVPAMISTIDQSDHIEILAPVMSEGAAFVLNKNLNIKTWDEFKKYLKKNENPVKIGYKSGFSVQNLIFENALHEERIAFSKDLRAAEVDVVLVNVYGAKNLITALEQDVIQGFVVMQPYVSIAEKAGVVNTVSQLKDILKDGRWNDHPCCAFAANKNSTRSHPEIAEALTELFIRANRYIILNSRDAAKITADWLGNDVEVEMLSLPTIKYSVGRTEEWDRGIKSWIDDLVKKGVINNRVRNAFYKGDLDEILYNNEIYEKALKSSR